MQKTNKHLQQLTTIYKIYQTLTTVNNIKKQKLRATNKSPPKKTKAKT